MVYKIIAKNESVICGKKERDDYYQAYGIWESNVFEISHDCEITSLLIDLANKIMDINPCVSKLTVQLVAVG